jgi:hypothetical protein
MATTAPPLPEFNELMTCLLGDDDNETAEEKLQKVTGLKLSPMEKLYGMKEKIVRQKQTQHWIKVGERIRTEEGKMYRVHGIHERGNGVKVILFEEKKPPRSIKLKIIPSPETIEGVQLQMRSVEEQQKKFLSSLSIIANSDLRANWKISMVEFVTAQEELTENDLKYMPMNWCLKQPVVSLLELFVIEAKITGFDPHEGFILTFGDECQRWFPASMMNCFLSIEYNAKLTQMYSENQLTHFGYHYTPTTSFGLTHVPALMESYPKQANPERNNLISAYLFQLLMNALALNASTQPIVSSLRIDGKPKSLILDFLMMITQH